MNASLPIRIHHRLQYFWILILIDIVFASTCLTAQSTIVLGNGQNNNETIFSRTSYYYSYRQSIYPKEMIGRSGIIDSIAFYRPSVHKTKNDGLLISDTIEIYLGMTHLDQLFYDEGWIPLDEFELVFRGVIKSEYPDDWIMLDIAPFAYSNSHNLMLAILDNQNNSYHTCYCKSTDGHGIRTLLKRGVTLIDPSAPGYGQEIHSTLDLRLIGDFGTTEYAQVYPGEVDLAYTANDTTRAFFFTSGDKPVILNQAKSWLHTEWKTHGELQLISKEINPDFDNPRYDSLYIQSGQREVRLVVRQDRRDLFQHTGTIISESKFAHIILADFDSDKDMDALMVSPRDLENQSYPVIFENQSGNLVRRKPFIGTAVGRGIAIGDIDNDNDVDIVQTGRDFRDGMPVSTIFRNEGNFNFVPTESNLVRVSESDVALSDLDNDGDQDIAICGLTAEKQPVTKIYWNSGDGTFYDSRIQLEGIYSGSILTDDLDQDSDQDILIGGLSGIDYQMILPMINDGKGGFETSETSILNYGTGIASSGDLNGDGFSDLLLSGNYNDQGVTNDWSRILINLDSLVYDIIDIPNVQSGNPGELVDFDNDGDYDYLHGHISRNISSGKESIRFDVEVPLPGEAFYVTAIDLENDGILELLATYISEAEKGVYVYRNQQEQPNTPPLPPSNLSARQSGNSIQLSWDRPIDDHTDSMSLTFNLRMGTTPGGSEVVSPLSDQDGFRKIKAYGNCSLNPSWRINSLLPGKYYWTVQAVDQAYQGSAFAQEQEFIILPDYKLIAGQTIPYGNNEIGYLLPADYDNDGDYDFLTERIHWGEPTSHERGIIRKSLVGSAYSYRPLEISINDYSTHDMQVGDLNNDGEVDIVIFASHIDGKNQFIELFLNQKGSRLYSQNITIGEAPPGIIRLADFDNDGDLDIFTTRDGTDVDYPQIAIYSNQGNGQFTYTDEITGFPDHVGFSAFEIQDFNRDGRLDYLVSGSINDNINMPVQRTMNLFIQYINNRFVIDTTFITPDTKFLETDFVDFNNDSYPDLFVLENDRYWNTGVSLYINDKGQGLRSADLQLNVSQEILGTCLDFNHDNMSDLLVANLSNNSFDAYLSNTNGRLSRESVDFEYDTPLMEMYNGGFSRLPRYCMLDLDGDHDLDLASIGSVHDDYVFGGAFWENINNYEIPLIPKPSGLNHQLVDHGIRKNWNRVDGNAYTFNVRVGSTPGGVDIISPHADPETGFLRIPTAGNAACNNFYWIESLPAGTYYWSVQAINKNKVGGLWAVEDSFSIGVLDVGFKTNGQCTGQNIQFMDESSGPVSNWSWDFGDGHTSDIQSPTHIYKEAGEYLVTLASEHNGFLFKETNTILIYPSPEVDFDFEAVGLGAYAPFVNLTDTLGLQIMEWEWDFGDGSGYKDMSPINHFYQDHGVYTVSLKATTQYGCTSAITKEVAICRELLEKPDIYARGPEVWYLACSNDSASMYQWYFNGEAIAGGNGPLYVVNQELGNYQVQISQDGECYVMSDIVSIPSYPLGQSGNVFSKMHIYPNPTTGLFRLILDNEINGKLHIQVYSEDGKLVSGSQHEKNTSYINLSIDLSSYPPGTYIIKLQLGQERAERKLIVK